MVPPSTTEEGQSGVDSLNDIHAATLFIGRGEYSIDDKGRLTLPPHMRKPLADGGRLAVLDDRAVIWTVRTYQDAVDTLNRLVATHDLTQGAVRIFLSNTHPVVPDPQGRIVVAHAVRVQASLERDVMVLGSGPRIEIVSASEAALDGVLGVDDSVVAALDLANF